MIRQLLRYIKRDWSGLHDHIFTAMGCKAIVLRFKGFVSKEQPKLLALCEHHQIVLYGVYGDENGRERLVGYCLLFGGASTIHHHPRYVCISYSEATDIRSRQLNLIYDDDEVRLARMGMGTFDYLWVCNRLTEEQLDVDAPGHAAYQMFKQTWKDGT